MRYSLWHKDTLIGHTELSYHTCMPRSRMGQFIPTDAGLVILAGNEHLEGLELQLRGETGCVIPTEYISTTDCNRLARLGREAAEGFELDEAELDEAEPDEETRASVEHDIALIEEWLAQREPDDLWQGYEGEEAWDETKPSYQIFVELCDATSIPANSDFLIEDSL